MSSLPVTDSSARPGRILLVGPGNPESDLGSSILWREDLERAHELDHDRGLRAAREYRPSVIVIDAGDGEAAVRLARAIREDQEARATGIVALIRSSDPALQEALRAAGANHVVPVPVDPALWDARLGSLLRVPPRRDVRIAVLLDAWSTLGPGAHLEGVALNISVRGILLETERPLDVGTKFDLSFSLPDAPGELQAVGEVVRLAADAGHARCGIQFLVLQGNARDRIEQFVAWAGAADASGRPRKVLSFRQTVERREWAAELRKSEARNAAILASVLDAIVIVDVAGLVVEWNPAAESAFGCPRAAAVGRPLGRFLDHSLDSGGPGLLGRREETTARRADGSTFPVELAVTRVPLDGESLFTLCLRDITERKRAESAQLQAAAQFRALFERAAEAMTVADDEGRYVEVNAAACALYGLERGALLGRWVGDLAGPDFEFQRLLRSSGGPKPAADLRLTRADGAVRDVELAVTADFLPGSHLIVLRDLTERHALESQLRQSQKMEAIGRLAGGVAHDFNNLLGVVAGYAELLLRRLPAAGAEHDKVEKIRDASAKGAELTRKLLAFSRRQMLQPQLFDPNRVVRSFAGMISGVIGDGIDMKLDLEPQLGRVKADPGQLEQVLMNLALNARDAMPQGGQILVETRNVELSETGERPSGARPGPYVRLRFSDTGTGMDAEVTRHVFEPFFTTKAAGHGTGLGLATAFGIVTQSEGVIEVASAPGRGTTFTVHLPRVDAAPDATTTEPPTSAARGGRETILVVEDQPMLRSMLCELFVDGGYTVLAAEDGQAALRVAEGHPAKIDVLVTDVVMPGLQGPDLAKRLKRARPGLKVVFCSGFTDDSSLRRGQLAEGTAFLPKPFAPADLERVVRRLLETAPGE